MKKKIILSLLILSVFTITGCGKTETKTEKKEENNVASTLTCVKKTDKYTKTNVINFDKDDMIINGTTTTEYVDFNDAEANYKELEKAQQDGVYTSVEIQNEDKRVIVKYTIDSSSLASIGYTKAARNKSNYLAAMKNSEFECE